MKISNSILLFFAIILNICFQLGFLKADIRDIDLIERLIDSENDEDEAEYALNLIEYYSNNKIKLLSASAAEIAQLPTFNRIIANQIKSFLSKSPNSTIVEICNQLELTELQRIILINCASVELGEASENNIDNYIKIKSIYDQPLQKSIGIAENKYKGDNFATSSRLAASISNYIFGFSIDKDIGEPILIDHYAFYLSKNIRGNRIIIGNFKVNSGLGLTLGNSFSSSKFSSLMYSNGELSNSITPDLSSFNSKSFRGVAYQTDWLFSKNLLLNMGFWFSNMDRSANFDDKNDVSSLYTSGLFRTETESRKKNNLSENLLGTNLEFRTQKLTATYSGIYLHYSIPANGNSSNMIRGKEAILQSISMQFNLDSLILSSEIANYKSDFAYLFNMKYYLGRNVLGLNVRYYSPDFRSPFGINGYENSYPSNEVGIGLGLMHRISKKVYTETVADYFETINRTYYNYLPIKGIDLENRLYVRLNNSNSFVLRVKYDNKDNQKTDDAKIKNIAKNISYRIRMDYNLRYSSKLKQKIRAEFTRASENINRDKSDGYLLSTEIIYKPISNIEIKQLLSAYNTDSYDAAIWILNSFANYTMQMKSLYQQGYYFKTNMAYSPSQYLNLYLQYAINYKPQNKTIGSGYSTIKENYEHMLRLNMSWSF